ncbi:MAG: hypothetical protein IPN74_16295 [Haliscomenobacter sp.]|nr:hypothetical protein [Haliscomenobacter sp.]
MLDRSDSNLKKQQESEDKANKTRELIYKDLKTLYVKLRQEELKDILMRVSENPEQIRIHTSRLLTLDMTEEHFVSLKNLFFKWSADEDTRYFNLNIVILLVSHFPNDVASNHELLPLIRHHFENSFISIGIDKLNIFIKKLKADFFENENQEIGQYLLEAIKALLKNYNPNYVALKMLFEDTPSKEDRFKLFTLIKTSPEVIHQLGLYKQMMINTYSDLAQNTKIQNNLIDEMKN